jgi:hypothetical protein
VISPTPKIKIKISMTLKEANGVIHNEILSKRTEKISSTTLKRLMRY